MSTAGRYQAVKEPHPGGRSIERVPDRMATKRQEAYMDALVPIYDRAGRACKTKGQLHLRDFEVPK